IARAGLQFTEQPRVLHRDDRLVGKGTHQLDLPLRERPNPLPSQIDDADRLALAQQWHAEQRSDFGERKCFRELVFRVCRDIDDLNWLALRYDSPGDVSRSGNDRVRIQKIRLEAAGVGVALRCRPDRSYIAKHIAVAPGDEGLLGSTWSRGGCDKG